jgi:hypothetical protein
MLDVGLAGVRQRDGGHLVRQRIRSGRDDGPADGIRVEAVHDHALGPELLQQAQLRRARGGGHHIVPAFHQPRDQPPPEHTASACHEDPHRVVLSPSARCGAD